ncbi:MAG: YfiR family protein [Woeseia sp.]
MNNCIRNVLVVLMLCWPAAQLCAQEAVYHDEEVKAAFLYHFATFVQWPETTQAGEVFTIAVLGADEIAAELEEFLPGRAIQGRPMDVRRLRSIEELDEERDDASVLFIGGALNSDLPQLIGTVGGRPMLVVTDAPGALRDGAMINFQVVDRRVRFEISLPAAERAGLQLSSRLLSAAMSVDTTSAVAKPPRTVLASAGPLRRHR